MKKATANQAAGADALAGHDVQTSVSHVADHIADTPKPPRRLPRDEFTGKGGDYVVIDGKRVPAPASTETAPPAAA